MLLLCMLLRSQQRSAMRCATCGLFFAYVWVGGVFLNAVAYGGLLLAGD
jgi:hypothetical protein